MSSLALRDFVARWWAGELGAGGVLLDVLAAPAALVFGGAVRARNAAYDRGLLSAARVGAPVISVGNLSVGGAGKTPVSSWLLRRLRQHGRRPALLHGGYAGDEPQLHRQWTPDVPVLAERDRVRAARTAIAAGADVLVLDDAFQHRRLHRDLDVVLVAAEGWTGRTPLLPRRGWREPAAALRRAQLVAVTRRTASAAEAEQVADALQSVAPAAALVRIWLRPVGWWQPAGNESPPPGDCLAVSAIAGGAGFAANARACGARVTAARSWPDHHAYDAADAAEILRQAGTGSIVTTMKDWVKLASLLPPQRVWVLQQEVVVEAGAEAIDRALEQVLQP